MHPKAGARAKVLPMPDAPSLADAIEYAVVRHAPQSDRGGQPYIFHPMRVMQAVFDATDGDVEAVKVAILHDVLEDTHATEADLRTRFGSQVTDRVVMLSRGLETYETYIERLIDSGDAIVLRVKLAALRDNLSQARRSNISSTKAARYQRACDQIEAALARITRPAVMPDPVWYGVCTHWTEDFKKLGRSQSGLPVCPLDGSPGFHAPGDWWQAVDRFEAEGNPGYRAKIEAKRIP